MRFSLMSSYLATPSDVHKHKMASTIMTTNGDSNDSPVQFIVTGFGPFRDSKENPSTIIANQLVQYLRKQGKESLACRITTRIIETSAKAARAELDTMLQDTNDINGTVVYLHLGVNYKGTKFQLEKCAYNDATFRIPDERGYQPRGKCVVDDCSLGTSLETRLPLEHMCKSLQTFCFSPVVVSTDPGRFVCNYTYYYSLSKTQHLPAVYSLFLHVPPFAVIPEQEQMQVVMEILQCLDK